MQSQIGEVAAFRPLGFREADPLWFFIRVREPKVAKNRDRADFAVADRAGEVARLEAVGAEVFAEHDEWGLDGQC
jgi:hypothetical protein